MNSAISIQKLLLLIPLFILAGCSGNDGPQRFDVSGTVTFEDQPAPGGSIVFTPDKSKGNSGPQGTAKIINGVYNTARQGRGIVGGPHEVLIIVTNGDDATEDAELSGPLTEHTEQFDFPKETSEHNFAIQ